MAASAKTCSRCLEPLRDCLCEPDEDETPPPFATPFTAPPWPPREDA